MKKSLSVILFIFITNILFAQTSCFEKLNRAVTCIVDSQTFTKDTILSIIPENCSHPFLKDSTDGIWKLVKSNNQIFKIFTIENREMNGMESYYHKNKILRSYEYKEGNLKKSYTFYKNGQLHSFKKFKPIPDGSQVIKSSFWDKNGNKIDELKSYDIWNLEYCE